MDGSQLLTTLRRSLFRVSVIGGRIFLYVFCAVLIAGLWQANSSVAVAEEPVLEFVEGLRERQYFDTALEYLDIAQQRSELSAAIRDVIDLERAKTLQAMGASSRVPEDRDLYLQQAKEALQKFTSAHSSHPQAALANSMLGELLLERARTLIWQMEGAESPDKRSEYQLAARKLIDEGQVIYQTSNDQYKAALEAFPRGFIDQIKEEEKYDARREADFKYQRAWFNLIRCTYERGLTFDKGTEERKKTLTTAASQFEVLHSHYRKEVVGLHARLMMGKCFQEQSDFSRALGIYNEMLANESENDSVAMLKAIALHYRLICLNDPERSDHQLVVQEATIWLQANKAKMSTPNGLGILWERAIAAEKLGAARDISEEDREATLRVALNDAATVARYRGPFQEPANAMSRRIKASLGDKDKEPKDFATAFERARQMSIQIQALSDDVNAAADANARAQKKAALDAHLHEVGRLLQVAMDLRDPHSDVKAVAQARFLQSFVMLKQGRPLDSMILAQYCMVHDRAADPDTASNATEIAMAAAVSAWNMAPGRDRDFETRALKDVCQKILELYPQSSRGGEARMRLATVYRTMNEPLEGAKWYLEVPESDPQYASARIGAGQSYWAAWLQKAAVAAESAEVGITPPEEMQTWKAEARKLLTQGIQLTRDKVGLDARPSEEVVKAEVSLASILNMDGDFQGTIEHLTGGEANSVVAAIQVADGEARPEEGIQSKSFAGLTYRLLLRAYVGTQQIDQALSVMTQLENVGGQDILAVYTQLGVELQDELKRLQMSGDNERLAQTRDSFEKFLLKVYESRNKSDYNSLLWIGETYYGLGQGVATDPIASAAYYARAADAYNEIISGGLATEGNRTAVQLRLARCRRQQKLFDDAFRVCDEILKSNPNALDAQFEMAHVLSDWGSESDPTKLLDAIQGIKTPDGKAGHIWGWSLMSRKLQQSLQRTPTPEMRERFIDSRYQLTNSRRRYAKTNAADSDKQLNSALAEVTSFVQVYRDLDDASFAKFDRLYQDLQADKGDAPVPLERASGAVGDVAEAEIVDDTTNGNPVAANVATATEPEESVGSGLLLGALITCLSIGIAGGMFFFMRRPSRRPTIPGSEKAPKFSALAMTNPGAINPAAMFPDPGDDPVPGLDFSGLAAVASAPRQKAAARPTGAATATRATSPAVSPRPKSPAPAAPSPGAADSQAASRPRPRPATEDKSGGPSSGPVGVPRPAAPRSPAARPAAPSTGVTPSETPPPAARPTAPRSPAQQQPPAGKPPGPPADRPPQRKPPIPPDSKQ